MFDHIVVARTFKEAMMIQARVIHALMLRETRTMYGKSKFGYLWAVINTAFGICLMWVIRGFIRSMDPYGLELPMFLLCGFTAWSCFNSSVTKVSSAVSSNLSLLYYSKVRHFDLIVARVLLLGATNVFVFICLATFFYLIGYKFEITTLWPFIIAWFYLLLLGTGVGAMCCALTRYFPSTMMFVNMIMRVGMFLSGVMWSYMRLPHWMVEYALLNPVFQLIEYSRTSFSYIYPGDVLDVPYTTFWTIAVLTVGLGAEILTRKNGMSYDQSHESRQTLQNPQRVQYSS